MVKIGSRQIWNVLFLLTGAISLWISASLCKTLFTYVRYSNQVIGSSERWQVVSLGEDKYGIYVDYTYEYNKRPHHGGYLFQAVYKTKEAAADRMDEMHADKLAIWITGGKEPLSRLERIIPYKELIRLFISLMILVYFYLLKQYLSRFTSESTSSGTKQ